MKKIKSMWSKLPKIVKKGFLFVLFLLVLDVLLAGFAATYLDEIPLFFNKPPFVVLSDLLFLEGALVFCIGAFFEFSQSFSRAKPSDKLRGNEQVTSRRRLLEQLVRPGTFMMIVGAILIGLSVMIGTLFA